MTAALFSPASVQSRPVFAIGERVRVQHGVSGWCGVVSSVMAGHIVVSYPGGNRPCDQLPAREIVSLSMHKVERI